MRCEEGAGAGYIHMLVIQAPQKLETGVGSEALGTFLVSQPSLNGRPQVSVRELVSESKVDVF